MMKQKLERNRLAAAALFAAVLLPFNPVMAQEAPVTSTPPAPVIDLTPPPVVTPPTTAPTPTQTTAPPSGATVIPRPRVVESTPRPAPAAEPAAERQRPDQRATRPATRTRAAAAPVRRAAPAATAAAEPAPAPVTAPEPVPPVAATPAPVAAEPLPTLPADTEPTRTGIDFASILPFLIAGGVLLIGLIAFFALRRRRREDEGVYEEYVLDQPAAPMAEPIMASEPVMAREEIIAPAAVAAAAIPANAEAAIDEAHPADVEALAAASDPVANRPWIEFLMRPVRAGVSQDDARVQFELTVGNTGTVPARDVRISTWMFAAGASEMERSLITPPADANVSEVDIQPGDGARVEGEVAIPRSSLNEPVLPVVVADARYRLPDGSEGRTMASFAVGRIEGDEITPFPVDRTGLTENVDARLHGEPERV